jgi:glycosyltransferase involved in cell wall biosynthesis
MNTIFLSLVVPVFNEQDCVIEFLNQTTSVLKNNQYLFEIIFIDDGSSDNTIPLIEKYINDNKDQNVKIIEFSYNHGKPLALTAGIHSSQGEIVILMDPDLQDPPEDIPRFVEKINQGHDLVFGVRKEKQDYFWNKIFSKWFWLTLDFFTGLKIPRNIAVMRAFNRRFKEAFEKYPETDRFIEGIFIKVGLKQTTIEIGNRQRFAGKSKFTFRKKIDLAVNAILAYSDLPLKLTIRFGLFLLFLSVISALALAYLRLFIMEFQIGWPSLIVLNLMGFGFVILFLGVIGSYIGAIFRESKRRPLYSIKREFSLYD